ncbi:caspase family protein [Streptomyces sp. NBC_00201]|uniref:HD domain-containing protein n=1 Tax=Streptomyces sp. NBC_00201 TaxID=2975679 RepID=UPI00225842D7|nr:caspase family protein [Streptomyces sp. NBC_00201]MCX5246906.1 caspase family protein [Streptomyces sp. NBC_00201]
MPPQHKALLIGASEYDDPRILDLPFVPDDLQRMRDALVERGFQSAEIVESKRGITPNTVNSRIRTFLRDADRGDTLFILLSGHGQHFKGSDYLIPEDATFDVEVFAETCIEIGWERELEESHATHVVFLVDACREGIDLDTMAPPGLKQWSQRKVADALRRKVAYVYACTAPQRARFVRPNDELRPGCEVGTRPGESFSLFSRAVADTICADPHALHLHDFFERVQQRVTDLHRAYGKEGAVQVITVRADTTPGGGNFPLLPGPERQPEAHPWIRAVEKHPVWQRTPDGSARQLLQQACVVLAGRLAPAYEEAARALHDDPWHDSELARRTHDRLGFLTGRLAAGEPLSPTEAALAVLLPLVEQTFWAQEAAQRVGLLTRDAGEQGPDHSRFRKFARGFPRLKRRLRTLDSEKTADDSVAHIRWWLFHRWLIQQPELYAAEALKSLLGDVAHDPDQPAWVADALSADRLMRLLKEHRTAPFSTRRAMAPAPQAADSAPHHDHDVIAASTGDEHEVRSALVSALVKAACAMAVDPIDLPEIVVEHIGIYDSVDLGSLVDTVRRSDWRNSGAGRSLNALCTHPAVQIALREHACRVDALLRDINRGDNPSLLPLRPLPAYADGSLVRLGGNTPDQLSDGIRFQLAEDRVQELLMGEQLYGDRRLAIRELYQNALDALRYRDCRTRYLQRTGQPVTAWEEGRIEFVQGVDDGDGRPYLECRDNGIGMSITELSSVFSQGGVRFVDLPEYVEEQVAWSELPEPKLRLYPNSRFGIGVLSYFMLADEIVVRTCRMGRDGKPGRLLQVTIAGPGNLFRVEDLGQGQESGTVVRLLLSRKGRGVSSVEALQRLLWVAPYRTTAVHGAREHEWVPGELNLVALEMRVSRPERSRPVSPACYASDSPDLWWVDHKGIALSDGLLTNSEGPGMARRLPYGIIVNLHSDHAPVLTVDRKSLRSFDQPHVLAVMTAAAPSLTRPGQALPNPEWLSAVSKSTLRFADVVAEHARRADLDWPLGDHSLPFSKVGHFLPDADLLPLVTGHYPADYAYSHAGFFYNFPSTVLRWRLRTLYSTGAGDPRSLPGAERSDALCARPSDLLLLAADGYMYALSWDKVLSDWRTDSGWQSAVNRLGLLFRWRDPAQPVSAAQIFHLSLKSEHPPAEVAERLTALGYQVEPLSGCAEAHCADLPLLRRIGDPLDWLAPGSSLSAAQVCVSAAQLRCSTLQAAQRLRELGFTVPEDVPARDHWTDQERAILRDLWKPYATPPPPETAVHVSRAQLVSSTYITRTTVRHTADFLTELGFDVPADASTGPEPTEEDYPLLLWSGQWAWVDQEVSLLYMAVVARHIHWPVTAVAERLRELGFTVAPVPDEDQLPSHEQTALVGFGTKLDMNRPLSLRAVAERADVTGIPLVDAIAHFAAQGFKCSVSVEALSRAEQDAPLALLGRVSDPHSFGPVSPDEVHAVGAEAAGPLRDFGFEVVPPTQAWLRERQLEEDLCQAVQATGHTPRPAPTPDDPPLSLVTLAVVGLSSGTTLREVALTATRLGIRHEIEDWFTPASEESPAP